MEREPKFRAWDITTQSMYYSDGETTVWCGGVTCSVNTDEGQVSGKFVPMQFTGLLDKNEKDRYIGDIFQHNGNNYVIVNSENHGIIALATDSQYKSFTGILMMDHRYRSFNWLYRTSKYCETIGNIQENPELLK